jgi:uncharacterized membrane protein
VVDKDLTASRPGSAVAARSPRALSPRALSTGARHALTTSRSLALLAGFLAVHGWLTVLGTRIKPETFNDLDLYRWWVNNGFAAHSWPVFDFPWVYPAGAIAPMAVAGAGGTGATTTYELAWSALVMVLDAFAILILVRHGRVRGAWWWLGFQTLLGMVAIGRLEGIIAPMMVVGLSLALERPQFSAALLTAGAWIKIAPGALLIALASAVRRPVRDVVVPAVVTCAVVVAAVVAGGGGANLLSFLTVQGNRGLQVESVAATPWVLAASARHDVAITYNTAINTYEVTGPGTSQLNSSLDAMLLVGLVILAALIWRARRRGSHALLASALATSALLIVLNKVGSPQFASWLAPPVAVALSRIGDDDAPRPSREGWHSWRVLATLLLVVAGLTQAVYPFGYTGVVSAELGMGLVLAMRNLLLVVVLTLAVVAVVRAGVDPPADDDLPADRTAPSSAAEGLPSGQTVR